MIVNASKSDIIPKKNHFTRGTIKLKTAVVRMPKQAISLIPSDGDNVTIGKTIPKANKTPLINIEKKPFLLCIGLTIDGF